jgi:hypothetical protein
MERPCATVRLNSGVLHAAVHTCVTRISFNEEIISRQRLGGYLIEKERLLKLMSYIYFLSCGVNYPSVKD